jgi:hypothetical protein
MITTYGQIEEPEDGITCTYSGPRSPELSEGCMSGQLLRLLLIANKTESPIQLSQLNPTSWEEWLEIEKDIHGLRARRFVYFEFDCRIPTCDIEILCVSDIPRSDEDFRRLIEEGVVYAGFCRHGVQTKSTDAAEKLFNSLSQQQRNDVIVIFDVWTQQGDPYHDDWCECPMITVELIEAIQGIMEKHSAAMVCTAIKKYAKVLLSDMNGELLTLDLISFLRFKDKTNSWLYPSFNPDYVGWEDD